MDEPIREQHVVVEPLHTAEPSTQPIPRLQERRFEIECRPCNRRIAFGLHEVHSGFKTHSALMWGVPDQYRIKCEYCLSYIEVKAVLPAWTHKYL